MRYFLERLLYRLMNSKYKDHFVVRGSTLLCIYDTSKIIRATKDLDFMGLSISNNIENITSVFKEVCNIPCPEDYVTFKEDTVSVIPINSKKEYTGARVKVVAQLGKTTERLQFDIGYDDVITPAAKIVKYPNIFKEMPSFDVKTYTIETALAEKIETIIAREYDNTRMKDFYDIYHIMNNINFNMDTLYTAIRNTFKHRGTELNNESVVFDVSFYVDDDMIALWKQFLKSYDLPVMTFYEIGLFIIKIVKPIITKIKIFS